MLDAWTYAERALSVIKVMREVIRAGGSSYKAPGRPKTGRLGRPTSELAVTLCGLH
jgi:hypothetical protein